MITFEVYNFRLKEFTCNNGSLKCGYFKIKLFVGDNDWIDIDNFKLMKNNKGFYILPPASVRNDRWEDFIKMSDCIKNDLADKAAAMYNTQVKYHVKH